MSPGAFFQFYEINCSIKLRGDIKCIKLTTRTWLPRYYTKHDSDSHVSTIIEQFTSEKVLLCDESIEMVEKLENIIVYKVIKILFAHTREISELLLFTYQKSIQPTFYERFIVSIHSFVPF